MKNQEQNDPQLDAAWELLKNAPETKAGPFFTRNVLREVRLLEDAKAQKGGWLSFLFRPQGLALAGAACALAVVAFVIFSQDNSGVNSAPAVAEVSDHTTTETVKALDPADEMETVEYLGQLMAVADPGQLSDAALADLLF